MCHSIYDALVAVDYVPCNVPVPNGRAVLVMLEDNDPVIQILIKGRATQLRHCPRVHRVNIDATYERIRCDPGIYLRHWPTQYQMADILTKGSFTKQQWDELLDLAQLRRPTNKTNGFTVIKKQIEEAPALPAIPDFPLAPPEITKTNKNKKKKKQSHLGVEGGAGGLAFMAVGSKVGKAVKYVAAAAVLVSQVRAATFNSFIHTTSIMIGNPADGTERASNDTRTGSRITLPTL